MKLSEITKPIEKDVKQRLLISSVNRLLYHDKSQNKLLHQKIVTTLATCFNKSVRDTVLAYLMSDLRCNVDTALAWLFEEYSIMQVRMFKIR